MSQSTSGTNRNDTPSLIPFADEARFANGLPDNSDSETHVAFFKYCIINYRRMEWEGSTLSEYFAEDFKAFTSDHFSEIPTSDRRTMRDFLRKRGVYVHKGRGVLISDALLEVVKDDVPWPTEQPESEEHSQDRNTNASNSRTQEMNADDVRATQDSQRRSNSSSGYTRQGISNLAKVHNYDADRYSGLTTDNFDRKLCLFEERCDQASVSDEDKNRAFSIMLTGRATDFYFDNLRGKGMSFSQLTSAIKRRFITAEHERTLVREWDSLNHQTVIAENVGKPRKQCLEELVGRIHALQSGLPNAYCNDEIFKNKLLNAVKDVEECRFAYFKPAETVEGLISDLHSSLAIQPTPSVSPALNANFIDRRYKRQRGRNQGNNNLQCIVCKKKGCWSTNHPKEERIAALRKNRQVRRYFTSSKDPADDTDNESRSEELEEEHLEELKDLAGSAHVVQIGFTPPKDLSENGENVADNTTAFIACTRDAAASHALTAECCSDLRYNDEYFYGVMIDTGCARASSGGLAQYRAYCRHVGEQENIDTSKRVFCKFGISGKISVGRARIKLPINHLVLEFCLHIIDGDLPILLSLADMDKLGIFYSNLHDVLVHQHTNESTEVMRFFAHPFVRWNPLQHCFFTYTELKRLHRRFGHPHTDKLYNLLKRADVSNVDSTTRAHLEEIARRCKPCQTYAQAPRRFKFALRDDKKFNHTVFVDIFYINKKPVLPVVDEATRYQAARWLPNVTAESVWRAIRLCWIDVYLGPPDIVTHDAGKQFVARAFQTNAELLHIETKDVPIETPNSMSYVERYHTPIRHAFKIVAAEAPDLDPEAALQTAVKSVNDSIGPDGLVPTLLVYGGLPRLDFSNENPTPSTFQRAVALRKATEAMSKHFAKSQVSTAVRTRNGPDTSDIHSAPLDSHVLVYRPELDRWDGPWTLLDIQGETCTVLLLPPSGPTKFRTTVVKRFIPALDDNDVNAPEQRNQNEPEGTHPETETTAEPQALTLTVQTKNRKELLTEEQNELVSFSAKMVPQSKDHEKFSASRRKEIDGLINRGVFVLATVADAKGHRIYSSRFVDYVKIEGTPEAFEKSRFIAQAVNDEIEFMTHAPTVARVSQRILPSIAASDDALHIQDRDVVQAYTQAKSKLARQIFIRPSPVLDYPPDFLFKAVLPIYGLPESGLHWFHTYTGYHTKKLRMTPSIYDTCFMFTDKCLASSSRSLSVPRGVVSLRTDDTMYACNKASTTEEERASKEFECKPAKFLKDGDKLKFNGATISQHGRSYRISQPDHIRKLNPLDSKNVTTADFVAERARGAYIAAVCRPDVTYAFSVASQITNPERKDFKALNNAINSMLNSSKKGLNFVPLDLDSIVMAVFVDAGFGANLDSSSQLGFIITLMDRIGYANVVHYGSLKSKRVTRSVLAAELFAMVHGFDISSTIRLAFNSMLDKVIPLHVYTDSRSLYDCLTCINQTTEKRLLIDLRMIRQSYERHEITEVFWIPTTQNPADAFTKAKETSALQQLMDENRLLLTPNS